MNVNKKRSFLSGIPSWGLAALSLVATIILFVILSILGDLMKINENIGDPLFYIFFDVLIAVCCFFIVRQNPKSIWYVSIICNVIGIISAIIEPNFWISSLWMFICGGWVLSIIASIIGYYIGRKLKVDDMNSA
jgi:Na+/melibiose symporter-like transporter